MRKKPEVRNKSTSPTKQTSGQNVKMKIKLKKTTPQSQNKPKATQRTVGKSNSKTTLNVKPQNTQSSKARPAKVIAPKQNNQKSILFSKGNNNQKSNVTNSKVTDTGPSGSKKDVDNSSFALSKPTADKSLVNVAHDVRINGCSSLFNVVQKATPTVKQLLFDECDLILECRFCRNLFRSLPNFISHKLNYCKSLFHPAMENGCSQFLNSNNTSRQISYQYYLDQSSNKAAATNQQDILDTSMNCDSSAINLELIRDGSIRLEDTQTMSSQSLYKNIDTLTQSVANSNDEQSAEAVKLVFEPVKGRSDSVMFQMKTDQSVCNSSSINMFQNREVLDRDTAILGPDGKAICTGTARGIEKIVRHLSAQIDLAHKKMEQNSTNQFLEKCDICQTVFNTEKAFRQHKRDAPDCARQSSFKILGTSSSKGFNEESPPVKRTKLEDNQIIKELFSKSPPKVLQTSPYKKTVGKAVKNLQYASQVGKLPTLKKNSSSSSPIPCIKCSAKFRNTYEMSAHLATQCVGVKRSNNAQTQAGKTSRISIQARNSYIKPDNHQKLIEMEERVPSVNNITNVDFNYNVSPVQPKPIDEETKIKTSEVTKDQTYSTNKLLIEQPVVPFLVSAKADSKSMYCPESTNRFFNNEESLDSLLHNGKAMSSSSESEGDQETVSNVTDSGISSVTGTSEENLESRVGLSESPFSLASAISPMTTDNALESSKLVKSNQQQKPDERVLTPKNKNLQKPTEVKRISLRNVQKASLAESTAANQATTKKRK